MVEKNPQFSVVAPLMRERARLVEELEAIDVTLAMLGAPVEAKATEPSKTQVAKRSDVDNASGDYEGMTFPAKVRFVLERSGKPLLTREVLEVLERDGVAPHSANKLTSVVAALNARRRDHGDVIHVGLGKWDLKNRYTEEEIVQIKKLEDGAHARDKVDHKRRMVNGINKRLAEGKHYGGIPKISPEQWDLALKLLSQGEKVWKNIHKSLQELTPEGQKPVSYTTVINYKPMWLNGETYPKKWERFYNKDSQSERRKPSKIRVVK